MINMSKTDRCERLEDRRIRTDRVSESSNRWKRINVFMVAGHHCDVTDGRSRETDKAGKDGAVDVQQFF